MFFLEVIKTKLLFTMIGISKQLAIGRIEKNKRFWGNVKRVSIFLWFRCLEMAHLVFLCTFEQFSNSSVFLFSHFSGNNNSEACKFELRFLSLILPHDIFTHTRFTRLMSTTRHGSKFSNVLRWPMKLRKQLRIDVFPPLHLQG
jgi:hypothetical protein